MYQSWHIRNKYGRFKIEHVDGVFYAYHLIEDNFDMNPVAASADLEGLLDTIITRNTNG